MSLQRSADNNDSQLLALLRDANDRTLGTEPRHLGSNSVKTGRALRHIASIDESAVDFSKDFAKIASNMQDVQLRANREANEARQERNAMLSGSDFDSDDLERAVPATLGEKLTGHKNENQSSLAHCSIHPRRKIEAYCEDCHQLLCIDCILEKHGRHRLSKPEEAATAERADAKKMTGSIRAHKSVLEAQILAIERCLRETEGEARRQRHKIG